MTFSDDNKAYHALFQHSSLGIIISDEEGFINKVNPFANRLFGYEENELVGQKIEILIPQSIKGKHVSYRASYNKQPSPRPMGVGMDLRAARKDGTEFPVEISLAVYEADGKKQILSFISDITVRKKAEEALKQLNIELEAKVQERTNELSQAILELQHINASLSQAEEDARQAYEKERELSELKSRFVSMASHEFRTPLSGILTSASLIGRYYALADKEKRDKHINIIKASVQSLTNILNEFLSLDKLEQGRVECHPSHFVLVDFAEELVGELQSLSHREGPIFYEHRGERGSVKLDKEMLRNVLINLLSNAMKYSSTDKPIYVTTELREMAVTLTIKDEGIGIPQEEQKHLFERFFRAPNALTIQGTGLGLNIVKRYLDLMNGSIHFASRENVGTTFTVMLPRELNV